MGKFNKFLSSLFLVILGIFLFSITIEYQTVGDFSFRLLPYEEYPGIGMYMPEIMFWGSIVLIVIIILALLFVIFSPKKVNKIEIKKDSGVLKFDKKAVENFALSIVEEESDILNPSVKAKMTKKKIKLLISGDLPDEDNIAAREQIVMDKIAVKFDKLLGVESKVETHIRFKNFDKKELKEIKDDKRKSEKEEKKKEREDRKLEKKEKEEPKQKQPRVK